MAPLEPVVTARDVLAALGQARRAVVIVSLGAYAACVAAGGPEWWSQVIYGKSALNWVASVELTWIAWLCAAIAVTLSAMRRRDVGTPRLWTALALAFAFLAVEEHFRIHVRLREGFFKPHGIATHWPLINPGDIVLLAYAAAGILVAARLDRDLRAHPVARRWFWLAVLAGAIGVGIDAANYEGWPLPFYRKVAFVEETFERLLSPMFFALAFLHYLAGVIERSRDEA